MVQQLESLMEENGALREETARAQLALQQEREEKHRLLKVFKDVLQAMKERGGSQSELRKFCCCEFPSA